MTASAEITTIFAVTGANHPVSVLNKIIISDAPYEIVEGSSVVGDTAGTLNLGDIAAGKPVLLWFEAVVGDFYLIIGSGTPSATNSHLYIPEGEGYPIPLNPNATAVPAISYKGDTAATSKFYYVLIGKE